MYNCAICLERKHNINRHTTDCNHKFCKFCIFEYLQKNINNTGIIPCPLCRCNIHYITNKPEYINYINCKATSLEAVNTCIQNINQRIPSRKTVLTAQIRDKLVAVLMEAFDEDELFH